MIKKSLSVVCLVSLCLCWANVASAAVVSQWSFNEGSGTVAGDSVGSNAGAFIGAPQWVAGHSGSALYFDGSGAGVKNTAAVGLPRFANDNWTTNVWLKFDGAAPGNFQFISGFGDNTLAGGLGSIRYLSSLSGAPYHAGLGSDFGATAGSYSTDNTWQMLTVTYFNAATSGWGVPLAVMYRNGVVFGAETFPGGIANRDPLYDAAPIMGVSLNSPWGGNFKGYIDEFQIHNVAMSTEDVVTLYNSQVPEPMTLVLLSIGGGILLRRRK